MKFVPENIKNIVPYPPGKPIEELERELGISNSIKIASNENPLGPSKKAVEAISKELNKLNRYPDGSCYYLKEKLAEKLGCDMENLIVGNGSSEIIEFVLRTFVQPGDEVISSEKTFVIYKIVSNIIGAKYTEVPLKNGFYYDLAAIKSAISDKTRVIFLSNPNNPTGTMFGQAEFDEFMSDISDDIVIALDEAYIEYVEGSKKIDASKYLDKKNLIIMRTFSKIYGLAGLRIGYGIARKLIVEYLNKIRAPFNVNSVAQIAALASLNDDEHVLNSINMNNEGVRFLYGEFEKMGLEYVRSYTNFILVNIKGSGHELYQKMLNDGVIIRSMKNYGLDDFIRVTVGTSQENERFINVLKKYVTS
ncbi:histidinol-phosphate transaminase [Thermodesulfobacteriota bacterium]